MPSTMRRARGARFVPESAPARDVRPGRSTRADVAPARPPDLRLVPAAGAAWAVVLLGLHMGPTGGVVGATLAAGVLLGGLRSRRAVLVAAGGCALGAALVVTAHT